MLPGEERATLCQEFGQGVDTACGAADRSDGQVVKHGPRVVRAVSTFLTRDERLPVVLLARLRRRLRLLAAVGPHRQPRREHPQQPRWPRPWRGGHLAGGPDRLRADAGPAGAARMAVADLVLRSLLAGRHGLPPPEDRARGRPRRRLLRGRALPRQLPARPRRRADPAQRAAHPRGAGRVLARRGHGRAGRRPAGLAGVRPSDPLRPAVGHGDAHGGRLRGRGRDPGGGPRHHRPADARQSEAAGDAAGTRADGPLLRQRALLVRRPPRPAGSRRRGRRRPLQRGLARLRGDRLRAAAGRRGGRGLPDDAAAGLVRPDRRRRDRLRRPRPVRRRPAQPGPRRAGLRGGGAHRGGPGAAGRRRACGGAARRRARGPRERGALPIAGRERVRHHPHRRGGRRDPVPHSLRRAALPAQGPRDRRDEPAGRGPPGGPGGRARARGRGDRPARDDARRGVARHAATATRAVRRGAGQLRPGRPLPGRRRPHPARHPRAQGPRGAPRPPGVPRPAHQPREPAALHRAPRARAAARSPRGAPGHRDLHRPRRLQERQRQPRPRRRRPAPRRAVAATPRLRARRRHHGPSRRRRVRRGGRGGRRPRRGVGRSRSGSSRRCGCPSSWVAARSSSARASASPRARGPARRPATSCATRTWPCTGPRARARGGWSCSRRACRRPSASGWSSRRTCAERSIAGSSRSSTSRSWRWPPAARGGRGPAPVGPPHAGPAAARRLPRGGGIRGGPARHREMGGRGGLPVRRRVAGARRHRAAAPADRQRHGAPAGLPRFRPDRRAGAGRVRACPRGASSWS